MISITPNNPNRIIDFIQPIQKPNEPIQPIKKPNEPQSIMVIDICDNFSYGEGHLDVWTNSDKEIVALQLDGSVPLVSDFKVIGIYEN